MPRSLVCLVGLWLQRVFDLALCIFLSYIAGHGLLCAGTTTQDFCWNEALPTRALVFTPFSSWSASFFSCSFSPPPPSVRPSFCLSFVSPLARKTVDGENNQVPERGPGPYPTPPDPQRRVPVGKPERRHPGHHVAPHVPACRLRLARAVQQAHDPAAQAEGSYANQCFFCVLLVGDSC